MYVLNSTHNFVIKHNQVTKGFYHNSIGILKSAAAAFPTRILIEIPLSSDFFEEFWYLFPWKLLTFLISKKQITLYHNSGIILIGMLRDQLKYLPLKFPTSILIKILEELHKNSTVIWVFEEFCRHLLNFSYRLHNSSKKSFSDWTKNKQQ